MNKKIYLLVIACLFNVAPAAFGQFFYLIQKEQNFDQTGSSTVVADSNPYDFSAQIGGSNQTDSNPPPPNSFNIPGNGTAIPLDSPSSGNSGEWKHKDFFATQGAMDAVYPNGGYTLTVSGNSGVINLSGDLYVNAPVAAINLSGSWSGNVFSVFAGQDLTINTNSIAGFTSGNFRVGIDASPNFGNGSVSDIQFDSFDDNLTDSSGNITIPGSMLQAGDGWNVEMEFNAFSSENGTLIPGGTAVGVYTTRTSFQVQAVPEPGEAALAAGLVGLSVAAFWRRKKLA